MTLRGTCPACFRDMPIAQSREYGFAEPSMQISVGRHGWWEEGGRQVGVYNKAWHEGTCFGVGWLPFEISTEGTEAYVEQRLFPLALSRENTLLHYAKRPTLRYSGDQVEYDAISHKRVRFAWQARLCDGDLATKSFYDYSTRVTVPGVPSYDTELQSAIAIISAELNAIRSEGANCCKAIITWKRASPRDETRVPTVHYQASGARVTYCGSRSMHGLQKTDDEAKTTCTRCLKALAAQTTYTAKIDSEKADGATLVQWLTAHGKPVGVAEIKKALSWDAKRINKALDRADRAIEHDWSKKPTKYTVRTERA